MKIKTPKLLTPGPQLQAPTLSPTIYGTLIRHKTSQTECDAMTYAFIPSYLAKVRSGMPIANKVQRMTQSLHTQNQSRSGASACLNGLSGSPSNHKLSAQRGIVQSGMTLIELMIVVVIIGILAGAATYMFKKQARKARAGEVDVVFAEMTLRQESFLTANGRYVSSAENAESFPPGVPFDTPREIGAFTAGTWPAQLRMDFGKTAVYCSYATVSTLTDIGAVGTLFEIDGTGPAGIPVPTGTRWYYNAARCDFDGDGVFSNYLQTSWSDQTMRINPGE